MSKDKKIPKPFLKWAGGKTQLLDRIIPNVLIDKSNNITNYFEPFVGGGAVFFELARLYNIKSAYLIDSNKDLMITYKVIQNNPEELIENLINLDKEYAESDNRKEMFYRKREEFNIIHDESFNGSEEVHVDIASLMIFLNKTCFNGLYRVNKNNGFNVPFANPKNPLICDESNIRKVHEKLNKNVTLICGDYSESLKYIDGNSFVYLDPPYRPINGKKSFEGYTKSGFDDDDQKDLAKYCDCISKKKNANFMLSNSDPTNVDENDNFFNNLYEKYDFNVYEVKAKRFINSNANKRGSIRELLVSNYELKL